MPDGRLDVAILGTMVHPIPDATKDSIVALSLPRSITFGMKLFW